MVITKGRNCLKISLYSIIGSRKTKKNVYYIYIINCSVVIVELRKFRVLFKLCFLGCLYVFVLFALSKNLNVWEKRV